MAYKLCASPKTSSRPLLVLYIIFTLNTRNIIFIPISLAHSASLLVSKKSIFLGEPKQKVKRISVGFDAFCSGRPASDFEAVLRLGTN